MSLLTAELTRVSVIVPCRNEVNYIHTFVNSLLNQERHGIELEVLIADGMSDDGTREVLKSVSAEHPEVRMIDNPGRIVSTGLNQAIQQASGDLVIRMDCHTEYAPDYIRRCVETMEQTGAACVGGPWRAVGKDDLQKAIALAFQSPFSSGGAGSHSLDYEGEVDAVYLGCWKKSTLHEVGMFDEELVRNQDDELGLRIARSGGKLWQSPFIKSDYYPRSSIKALFKQYSQYGYWKVRVIQKHRIPASIRHLVPGAFVGSLILLAALSLFVEPARWIFFGLLGMYVVANLAATILTCLKPGALRFLPIMPAVFAGYHFGYGYGFLRGLIDFVLLKRGGSRSFSNLTRGKSA